MNVESKLRNYITRGYIVRIKNLFQSLRLKSLGNFSQLNIWKNRFSIFLFFETADPETDPVWFPDV